MRRKAAETSAPKRHSTVDELGALANELLAAFFDLRAAGQRIGAVADWGGGTWGLMKTLAEEGPITMAEFARRRAVSRQYIQKIANELMARGFVVLQANPKHRRSGLLVLTAAGRRELRDVSARIRRQLAQWCESMDSRSVTAATKTVADFRRMVAGTSQT
jgi:DNA-binding MarR family transcriptional regulator